MHFNEVKGNFPELITRNDCCIFLLSVVSLHLCMCPIPHALGCSSFCGWRKEHFVWSVQNCFSSHPSYPTFYCSIQYDGCLSSRGGMGAHSCIVRFCKPLVQFPSWSWLLKVEPPGSLRCATST